MSAPYGPGFLRMRDVIRRTMLRLRVWIRRTLRRLVCTRNGQRFFVPKRLRNGVGTALTIRYEKRPIRRVTPVISELTVKDSCHQRRARIAHHCT